MISFNRFAPGSANGDEQCFDFTIVQDLTFEENETFSFQIIDVVNGMLGSVSATQITILGDDAGKEKQILRYMLRLINLLSLRVIAFSMQNTLLVLCRKLCSNW